MNAHQRPSCAHHWLLYSWTNHWGWWRCVTCKRTRVKLRPSS